jgi:hypothetical protein
VQRRMQAVLNERAVLVEAPQTENEAVTREQAPYSM